MKFHCKECHKMIEDNPVMHYSMRHNNILESRYTPKEIANAIDNIYNPKKSMKHKIEEKFIDLVEYVMQLARLVKPRGF